ncbi:uncharacterized protein LOC132872278 [Neoarius graeffei]|uniref:uncharacterized protein LOC132872278 n=1 Tax=Neoarius graeffei TaxID=443677 RepID=UPI00298BD98D|nr:uncharacterized protein LOC132872278 [Neoarius graeffei]
MGTRRMLELKRLMRTEHVSYIKGEVSFCSYQISRTCVLDSLLAAFHITFLMFSNVEELFNSDEIFKNIMTLLNGKKYVEAKVVCAWQLKHVKFDHKGKIDFYGTIQDHFPLYHRLVRAEMTCDQKFSNDSPIYDEILSIFNTFGYIKALGHPADPTLLLGFCLTNEPPLHVKDKKKRTFKLQFLLLGKEGHMTMCFRLHENQWIFYDNDKSKPSFQLFPFNLIKDYIICLAGYVNITQAQEYKLGIPETGEGTGASPFYSDSRSFPLNSGQFVEDVEMEDLSSYPIAVPETGEGLGPKPF